MAPATSTAVKKDIPKGNALAEKNKNLSILPKASSAALPRLPLKCTVQTASEQARTHYKEKAGNSLAKEQQTKPTIHTRVTDRKQNKIVKKGPAAVSSQAQDLHRCLKNTHTSLKTDLQKRPLVTGLEKISLKSQVKCPTEKERLTSVAPSCSDTKSLISKKATVTLKTTKENNNFNKMHTDLKKPLNRYPPAKPDRSGNTQTGSQDSRSNKLDTKPGLTRTQKCAPVTARQRSSLLSTFSKAENASQSTSVPVAGVKKAAPHQQQWRTTFKLPSKPTVEAPGSQTLPRPTKTSNLTKGPVQPKTPKSTFNPGTNGVRTVPLDARNKPTTAQEERL